MTVKQNLELMLADAIALKRPAAEIAGIRRQLAAYEPATVAQIRAKQRAFLKAVAP